MKLSDLLASRRTLIRQAALANMAYVYRSLAQLAHRVELARLKGSVRLRQSTDPEEGGWATLTALAGSQAVIEEHFTESDVVELAEGVFFLQESDGRDVTFPIEELGSRFQAPLRKAFEKAGITIDLEIAVGPERGQANPAA